MSNYPIIDIQCYSGAAYFHKTMSAPMHCNATKCSIISEPDFGLLFSSFFGGRVNGSVDKGVFGFLKFWWQSHRKHLCWTLVFDNSLLFNVHDGWHWWLKWSKTGQLGPFFKCEPIGRGQHFPHFDCSGWVLVSWLGRADTEEVKVNHTVS